MDQPQITVNRMSYVVPVRVTGTDEQGRTTLDCPQCSGPAHVEEDGRVICEDWAPIQAFLADAYEQLVQAFEGVQA